ncbi:DUF3426 domain-containing protein [Noviherbaspirillum sedimenti]|uniref:DUF3426 domain-containing protein n=1 Tax=Noviherbaspirillum sedimenti TaxID=2320865 RepID=A0A3A3G710_9BURK|nr:DUF3426 domain-containing protein [Noviherbaspirillum sedimenti]RJG03741.1 DUF3426 domain-containing protein [Noviherbaspirillum sedimenti]
MALATQCPHCQTTFKVAHDQLKLRAGLVRCGACKQIFNGIEHLVPPELSATGSTPASPENHAPPAAAIPPQGDAATPPHAGTETAIDALEFIAIDDPETQTRILSPEPAAEAEAETEDDPLTRMTLVDFSVFSEDTDQASPQERATAAAPSVDDSEIWPDSRAGIAEPETPAPVAVPPQAAPLELPPDAVVDTWSADTLAAPPADGPGRSAIVEENAATSDQDRFEAMPKTSAAASFAEAAAEDEAQDATATTIAADEGKRAESAEESEEPAFVTSGRRRQRRRRAGHIFMALASILLFMAALGQGAYAFRDLLAAWHPQTRPALSRLCELAGCQIRLPAQIEQVSIESNELQAQANNKNAFTLRLLLHNRSAVAQAWPHIELTLNDNNGKALVRRALAPREYLPSDKDPSQGIAARSEQVVSRSFELSQLQASDYRVYLFYP